MVMVKQKKCHKREVYEWIRYEMNKRKADEGRFSRCRRERGKKKQRPMATEAEAEADRAGNVATAVLGQITGRDRDTHTTGEAAGQASPEKRGRRQMRGEDRREAGGAPLPGFAVKGNRRRNVTVAKWDTESELGGRRDGDRETEMD